MKVISLLPFCASFALIACSGSGGGSKAIYHPDVGPFDENGDYIEALADAPVKKNFFSRSKKKSKPKPEKVKAPEPPKVQRIAQAAPLTPAPVAAPRPAATLRPTPVSAPAPARTVVIAQSPRPQAVPVARAQPSPVPAPVAAPSPAPAPKPQAVVMKPKKKAPVRHVVKKSDTLYGLSRKYGVSVGSIQRANSLRGTTIVTGRTILIPR